jgi:hypothetical protein
MAARGGLRAASTLQEGRQVNEKDYVIEVQGGVASHAPSPWDALLAAQGADTPFMRHAYLSALEASGSVGGDTGWEPLTLAVRSRRRAPRTGEPALVAAAPAYLKSHSYGEYVFDWAWADAYRRYGLEYYPKLVVAVPFTPVPGARLAARDDAARDALVGGLQALARQLEVSSVHLLFGDDADHAAADRAGWMTRHGVQFHWHNRTPEPYADFDDFLHGLQREKRKKIAQERRYVREAGVTFETFEGAAIGDEEWDFFYACYRTTYARHHSTPYLTRAFFAAMQSRMAAHWVLFIASRAGRRIACALVAIDRAARVAWGRYWGALESISCVHFEACYYQPLQWCIEQRFDRFEGGAQGEHKMARGLLPQRTRSAHWIAEPRFAEAIRSHLDQEAGAIETYLDELDDRSPFARRAAPP